MSPLFLVPYLLFFLYQSYAALKKRTMASRNTAPTDAEKGSPDATPAAPSGGSSSGVDIGSPSSVRNLNVIQTNPLPSDDDPSFDDRDDFADADRGFIAALEPGVIKTADGKGVAWDVDQFGFLNRDPSSLPTVHPHLVRQGQLSAKQGLYEVAPGVFQVRALDISNMTILEGDEGIVVIDPLISVECAKASVELYFAHRGRRPLTGLVFSHSHADHYAGAAGVVPADFDPASVPILAPEGFLEAAVSEHVVAGPGMLKRALFMYGMALPKNPRGQVGSGLGLGASAGAQSLVVPNRLIRATGEEHVIDGVRIVFQMVPDTEAPAEMNFFFPATSVLLIAETATNCMHNIVTLRGAKVRDAKAWSLYLDEAISLFGAASDVLIGSHNWPMWGRERIVERLAVQRDLYGYMHDQTLRLANLGKNGTEIAEILQLPPAVSRAWYCRGFYGSLNHNVKGIYQSYLTWFDGDPAHLWKYPAREEGQRYVDTIGGVDALNAKAEAYIAQGDSRFAVTLLSHAVAAAGGSSAATTAASVVSPPPLLRTKRLLIVAYENLGFGAENATWRNFFLTAALELRTGRDLRSSVPGRAELGPTLPVAQWFDILSVQLHGERATARGASLAIDVEVVDEAPDADARWRLIVSNGVLTRRRAAATSALVTKTARQPETPHLALTATRAQLLAVLTGGGAAKRPVDVIKHEGDLGALDQLLELVAE